MDRDYGAEIENLRQEMSELKELLTALVQGQKEKDEPKNIKLEASDEEDSDVFKEIKKHYSKNGRVFRIPGIRPNQKHSDILEELCTLADERGQSGAVTYLGVFSTGSPQSCQQSSWIQNEINTDDYLKLAEGNIASDVLQAIGNNDRLRLLTALLKQPMTVAELVDKCRFSSTGQVYHHLNQLLGIDILQEVPQSRGQYTVKPHRVQGIIMILAGISDIVDGKYSRGEWAEETKA